MAWNFTGRKEEHDHHLQGSLLLPQHVFGCTAYSLEQQSVSFWVMVQGRSVFFKESEILDPSTYNEAMKGGFISNQIPGIDYNDNSSIHTFLSITVFLHGELEEEIYMDQPKGSMVPSKEKFAVVQEGEPLEITNMKR
ncbi:hypothetical protein ACJX0J_015627, partial [Zea mays]